MVCFVRMEPAGLADARAGVLEGPFFLPLDMSAGNPLFLVVAAWSQAPFLSLEAERLPVLVHGFRLHCRIAVTAVSGSALNLHPAWSHGSGQCPMDGLDSGWFDSIDASVEFYSAGNLVRPALSVGISG